MAQCKSRLDLRWNNPDNTMQIFCALEPGHKGPHSAARGTMMSIVYALKKNRTALEGEGPRWGDGDVLDAVNHLTTLELVGH